MTVQVVTDSSCCLSRDQLRVSGVRLAALHLLVDGVEVPEDDIGLPEDWLDRQDVSTAAANEAELGALYAEALGASAGDGVVAVHLSGALSGTAAAGEAAAGRFEGAVRVVDSRQAAMGVGFAVLAAARAARDGAALGEVADVAQRTAAEAATSGCVDRLDRLRRSGRIPRATWLVGAALAIRPVLRLSDGKLAVAERTRTLSRALDKLVDLADAQAAGREAAVAVRHLRAETHAARLAETLTTKLRLVGEVDIGPMNRALGAHLGRGAVVLTVLPV